MKQQWFGVGALLLINLGAKADPQLDDLIAQSNKHEQPTSKVTCYVTIMKSPCWQDYDVSIDVIDSVGQKTLIPTVHVKDDALWQRRKIPCYPRQSIQFTAQFSPFIWEGDDNKTYQSNHRWYMPSEIEPGIKAWNLPICFPTDFADLPTPPQAKSICNCKYTRQMVSPLPEAATETATSKAK